MQAGLRSAAIFPILFSTLMASAQCPSIVDIALQPNENDQIEVWLRPVSDFDGVFSSISFTIRWLDGQADLGSISQEMAPYMNLGTSGPQHVDGIYRYQIYAGFGFSSLASNGVMWTAGEPVLLTRINVLNGNSFFEISDDAFTVDPATNGEFYVSLNGEECPGEIYSISTGGVQAGPASPEVMITPNPTSGRASVNVVLSGEEDLRFDLFDPTGKLVLQRTRPDRSGTHTEHLDLHGLSNGAYMLQLHIGDRMSTHRIVLANGVR